METRDPSPILTAAECAARTGLTARALRLYEEQGLISPRRNAGGWRVYGAEELAQLNTITLLKSAGLTLAQVASVTGRAAQQPALEQIVALQLESWKGRLASSCPAYIPPLHIWVQSNLSIFRALVAKVGMSMMFATNGERPASESFCGPTGSLPERSSRSRKVPFLSVRKRSKWKGSSLPRLIHARSMSSRYSLEHRALPHGKTSVPEELKPNVRTTGMRSLDFRSTVLADQ